MKLYGYLGSGSAVIEAQLAIYDLSVELIDGAPSVDSPVAKLNPLRQVPVLEPGDGTVMTESAAITLWLADLTGRDDLVPPHDAPERAAFLRWLIFIVANIYPCFTFADDATRFVADPEAAKAFRRAVDDEQKRLWLLVEGAAQGPWFLGERLSAIDLYVAVMNRWRPGSDWFRDNAPKLSAIAGAVPDLPALGPVFARHFDQG